MRGVSPVGEGERKGGREGGRKGERGGRKRWREKWSQDHREGGIKGEGGRMGRGWGGVNGKIVSHAYSFHFMWKI